VIDNSEQLSALQRDLGIVAKLQKDYNLKVFKNLEEKKKKTFETSTEEVSPFEGVN